MIKNADIPECDECGGVVKPDIVFFGESVYGIDEAVLQVINIRTSTSIRFLPRSSSRSKPARASEEGHRSE